MELTVKLTGLYRDRKFSDRYKIQTNTKGNLTLSTDTIYSLDEIAVMFNTTKTNLKPLINN
jgi:hypothetical protein